MEIDNPQAFDHIIGVNGEIIQPKVVSAAGIEDAKISTTPVIWRKTTADIFHLPPGLVTRNAIRIRAKIIDIGVWDMDATTDVDVVHGLTFANIRTVEATIIRDDSTWLFPLSCCNTPVAVDRQGGVYGWDATIVRLFRLSGGKFDHVDYNDGVMNRGYITIWYSL